MQMDHESVSRAFTLCSPSQAHLSPLLFIVLCSLDITAKVNNKEQQNKYLNFARLDSYIPNSLPILLSSL